MKECWNCLRKLPDEAPLCEMCGATLPVIHAPPPAPEPERRADKTHRDTTPYARREFRLDRPASMQERASEAAGFYAERAAVELGRVQRLLQAVGDNLQAAAVLIACVAVVIYLGLVQPKQEELGTMDAASFEQAMALGLFVRQVVPSVETVNWNGGKIRVDEAWIGQLGRYKYASLFTDSTMIVQSGRYRMYFLTSQTDVSGKPQFHVGDPSREVPALKLERNRKPVLVHYVDLPSFVTKPQAIRVLDPARPQDGVARFTLH